MPPLRQTIEQNQLLLDAQIQWLDKYRGGFFVSAEKRAACDNAKNQAMAVIVCGKAVLSLIASLVSDVKLYGDTRTLYASSKESSVEIVHLGRGILTSRGSPDGILSIDDRIVAAKQNLLAKVNEYNTLIQVFRCNQDFRWGITVNCVAVEEGLGVEHFD